LVPIIISFDHPTPDRVELVGEDERVEGCHHFVCRETLEKIFGKERMHLGRNHVGVKVVRECGIQLGL
jgi:hypothetical protein